MHQVDFWLDLGCKGTSETHHFLLLKGKPHTSHPQETMIILAGKLLLWSSFVSIYLIDTTTVAQPRFIAFECVESVNFIRNSTYERNLAVNLAALPITNSGFGFFNFSTGQGSDRVNSVALCRGDVAPDICRSCLNDSIVRLREICPNQKEAIGYYDNCMLKYSNQTILGSTRISFYVVYANLQDASDKDRFNSLLRPLMNQLRIEAAAGGPLRKFAAGNTTGPDLTTIYGLHQCTPDLSELECSSCLEDAVNRFANNESNSGKVGGRTLLPMCNFRYEIHEFYNQSNLVVPPPPPGEGNKSFARNKGSKEAVPVKKSGLKWKLIIGFSCGLAGIMLLLFAILYIKRTLWETRKAANHQIELFIKKYENLAPKRFRYSEIKKITNSFHLKLGQGGYGSVYKGQLPDGDLVAVKLLNEAKGDGEDFINEVASISRTSHVNIVTLLGFCFEGEKRALVYEFMPNGSLDKFLRGNGSRLDWNTLFKISKGIARGLEYLHQGCNTRIVHFDIKPHNILLDEEFVPKISDFGLAKLCKKKKSIVSIMGARGTPGYIAPEVFFKRGASPKSDVYSYGRMVLEMTGARKTNNAGPTSSSEASFLDLIYKQVEARDNLGINGVTSEEEEELARKMVTVSLWCIQYNPSDRPSIGKVVEMLEGSLESLQVPPKRFWSSPTRSAECTPLSARQSTTT